MIPRTSNYPPWQKQAKEQLLSSAAIACAITFSTRSFRLEPPPCYNWVPDEGEGTDERRGVDYDSSSSGVQWISRQLPTLADTRWSDTRPKDQLPLVCSPAVTPRLHCSSAKLGRQATWSQAVQLTQAILVYIIPSCLRRYPIQLTGLQRAGNTQQALTRKPRLAADGLNVILQIHGQPATYPARVARFALYEVTSERLESAEAQPLRATAARPALPPSGLLYRLKRTERA